MTYPIAPARKRFVPAHLLVGLLVIVTLNGCAMLDRGAGKDPDTAPPAQSKTADNTLRDRLNAGYSDLYSNVDGLSQVDKIFYVKVESDDVEKVVTDVTGYCGELARRLESLTADYPALDIKREIDPPIIKAARDAQKKATLKRFAPVVGDSGTAFERGLLIRLLGAVDQQHYMAATLAEREPEPGLSKIMANAADRFADFYEEIDSLLKARFYR
ncbi:hypothetical protein [Salinisphaera sp.]|uniref:hypothetical protein n=1 Tax=Salinisphaera sp. TaxID=1914330 RepID=UPI000C50D51D|nr:hypothetical protein [Salinisphaera sp.]MBS63408.1 hypothetical protein [Salinisphaera sp.]